MQGDHFENFFQPRLAAHGYDGVFKSKTRDALGDNPNAIDGCAIFFRRDRFALMEQYSIEFNEAARQFLERSHHVADKKAALRRLLKVGGVVDELLGVQRLPSYLINVMVSDSGQCCFGGSTRGA